MENQGYINVFVDVHNKVRAFKDRLREANKGRADLREDRLVRETKEMEISAFFAGAAAILMLFSTGLSLAWFGRVL